MPLLIALLTGAVAGVAVAAAIHMPRVDALADYTPSLVTQLYAHDGSVFATFARERRVLLKEAQIPRVLQQAVLASEDSNFFHHGGIDALGIARAAVTDIKAGHVVEGASTITMQLARSLFLSRERTWRRKVEEASGTRHAPVPGPRACSAAGRSGAGGRRQAPGPSPPPGRGRTR